MNTGQLSSASLLMQSLGWALLHSLWQGALIYGALWGLLKILRNTNAVARYYLALISFAGMALWFADSWLNQWQRLQATTVHITQAGAGIMKTYSASALPDSTLHGGLLHNIIQELALYIPFIVSLYILGLLFMLLRFGVNIFQVRALRRNGIVQPGMEWQELLYRHQSDFNITRKIGLYFSEKIQTPLMVGVIKPIILFPVAIINHLSIDQAEAILLHELAHIKRHDYLVNVLQNIIEAILFFNPFIWLISGIIRKEREHCCDDLVVAHTAQPLPYAKALAVLEACRMENNPIMLAATGHKNQLFHRIKRIMEMKKNATNYSQLIVVLLAIVAITITVTCFTPTYAQKKVSTDSTKTKRLIRDGVTTTFIDKNGKTHTSRTAVDTIIYYATDDVKNNKDDSEEEQKIFRQLEIAGLDKDELSLVGTTVPFEKIKKWIEFSKIKSSNGISLGGIENVNWNEMKAIIDNYLNDDMLSKMQDDGLVDRTGKFRIKKTDKGLYINGELQPQSVYDKYEHYMKRGDVSIKGRNNNVDIKVSD